MTPREIVNEYYRLANLNDWDKWCDLFADHQVMDEQLAGHIEGLDTLRSMMKGMKAAFPTFQNVPYEVLIDGDRAAVKSHITAVNAAGKHIDSDVMNFFRFENGKIVYMSNHHDSAPFK